MLKFGGMFIWSHTFFNGSFCVIRLDNRPVGTWYRIILRSTAGKEEKIYVFLEKRKINLYQLPGEERRNNLALERGEDGSI